MVSFLNHIFCWGRFWPKLMFFWRDRNNGSWPPRSYDFFCILKHLLNHICVTEALNRSQKPPNMVLYHGKFTQPFSQYPVWAGLTCGAVYPLYNYRQPSAIETLAATIMKWRLYKEKITVKSGNIHQQHCFWVQSGTRLYTAIYWYIYRQL